MKKLENHSLEICSKEIQDLINNIYEIRNPKISLIEGPQKQDSETEWSYDVTLHFDAKERNSKIYNEYEHDWHVFSVTKIFRIPESYFREKTKNLIAKFQKTNTLIEKVLYKGEVYKVLYKYSSGFWDIQKNDKSKKKFIDDSEVMIISE
ncbi:hypothetical protein [Bacillus sp. V5-8f]|uniref:hypothetical protein n=1 Tax=Bacillus sp. V5-8f TaxID=2053044 RepID=UPI000C7929B3|nr:hypothetical protein [Bacillus sp. V5-8f]PLT32544.1 hypothetical protein CUU64_18760 [Bacillus sp. V5-8f]